MGKSLGRDEKAILTGGNLNMEISNYNNQFYNPKKEFVLSKTSKNVIDFKKVNHRD